jgi:hypothetical protein
LEPTALLTVATVVDEELQTADAVRSWNELSEKIPVAVNCCEVPAAMLGFVGATWIDTSVAEVTVSVVLPKIVPEVAVIVVGPAATAVARPLEPTALLTVATVVDEELQTADAVRSWNELSEKIPVAVNCCEVPAAMLGFVGATWIDTSVAEVTVSVVLPEIVPDIALMTVEPVATAVASPLEPLVLLTVATGIDEELQVTIAVMSWIVLSEKIPVAVNCLLVPSAMLGFVGSTSTDTSVAVVTVSVVLPEIPPNVAVIVVDPAATAVARPLEPAVLLTVATVVNEELQATEAVMSWLLLSE